MIHVYFLLHGEEYHETRSGKGETSGERELEEGMMLLSRGSSALIVVTKGMARSSWLSVSTICTEGQGEGTGATLMSSSARYYI